MKHLKALIRKALYGKPWTQRLFTMVWHVGLLGMNYGVSPRTDESGESHLLQTLSRRLSGPGYIVFDIGANVGDYSALVHRFFAGRCTIHAFEPSAVAFRAMQTALSGMPDIHLHDIGFSSQSGSATLFSNKQGGGLGSLYQRRLEERGIRMDQREQVRLETLDTFCEKQGITKIDFMKIDAEGHEFEILRGATKLLANHRIDYLQFEFGGCDIDSKIFFKDFWELLHNDFQIYRILKTGLYRIKSYDERMEIFTATNYFAMLTTLPPL